MSGAGLPRGVVWIGSKQNCYWSAPVSSCKEWLNNPPQVVVGARPQHCRLSPEKKDLKKFLCSQNFLCLRIQYHRLLLVKPTKSSNARKINIEGNVLCLAAAIVENILSYDLTQCFASPFRCLL